MFTSLGEERAVLFVSRAFVYFARVNLCPFSLPLGVRDWLRLVIVALPGLFINLFFRNVYDLIDVPDNTVFRNISVSV